jgi:hypothetical protein
MISQIAAIIVKVVAEAPELGHGDTEAKPKPEPRAIRTKARAAAANAPPKIAGHAMPEIAVSRGRPTSPEPKVSARLFTEALTISVLPS